MRFVSLLACASLCACASTGQTPARSACSEAATCVVPANDAVAANQIVVVGHGQQADLVVVSTSRSMRVSDEHSSGQRPALDWQADGARMVDKSALRRHVERPRLGPSALAKPPL